MRGRVHSPRGYIEEGEAGRSRGWHLIRAQLENHGLKSENVTFETDGHELIREYKRERGFETWSARRQHHPQDSRG